MPKGPGKKKGKRVVEILKKNPSGIWIRVLARQANMPVVTVFYYLNKFMENDIEINAARFGGIDHEQMKVVRLKGWKSLKSTHSRREEIVKAR